MNESLSKTTTELTNEQCDDLVIAGDCNYLNAILGYTRNGLTQPEIKERVSGLGSPMSIRTIQRNVTVLRKQGLLPAVGEAPRSKRRHRQQERSNRQNGGMATISTSDLSTQQHDFILRTAPAPQQRCVQTEADAEATADSGSTVVFPEVVDMSGEHDYERALELLEELRTLTKTHFATGWTQLQWNTIGGYCRTISDCCDARGGRKCSASKQPVSVEPTFAHSQN